MGIIVDALFGRGDADLCQHLDGALPGFCLASVFVQHHGFTDLRAEGGHRVSAERKGGKTAWVRIVAGSAGRLRLRDPFAGRPAKWSREIEKIGGSYECVLKAGDVLEARCDAAEETR